VVVLGGERSAGLTAVRSLGRRGLRVVVGSIHEHAVAARSRSAASAFVYPDPITAPAEFGLAVLDEVKLHSAALTIPFTEGACAALAAARKNFEGHTRLAVASDQALSVVLSRSGTRELANRLGIPATEGVEVPSVQAGLEAAARLGFPVIAAPDSRVSRIAGVATDGARHAAAPAELVRCLNLFLRLGAAYVARPAQGEGVGLAVLCRGGSLLWAGQYRRLHELGPLEGVSGYRQSERVDPALLGHAQRLLAALSWDGAAELHFRRSGGEYRLTRIGATLVEALPVAAAAGADVPAFLHDLEVHDRRHFPAQYRVGVYCRHLPSEVAWVREIVLPRPAVSIVSGRPGALRALTDMARMLSPWGRWDAQSLTDPRPGVHELSAVSAEVWQGVAWRLARIRLRRRMRRVARHPDQLAAHVVTARTILFVCLGNIIRSAFAAGLLRARAAGRPDVQIRSAGLDAATGHPADPTAVHCARRFGVDLSAHQTRRVDRTAIEEADLLLAMEVDHVVELCRRFPQHRHKVYLFGCLTDQEAHDVADPVYAPQEVFDATFDRIDRGIRRMVEMLRRPPRALAAAGQVGS
jgi:protein-tyrosine-phosphatase